MTAIIYIDRTKYADDGCDWTHVIVWHMKAGARARSRSVLVPAPPPFTAPQVTTTLPEVCSAKEIAA
ncbi:hypothetical protein [Citrobacter sp. BDA59-3]|uniref:hypothetical protein n=1 Tax=Citrobacter sp. BDA59-3 TaxID=2781952 RepID=UPI001882B043|nr:hypothetical protein [Citrobacter sp. BDA59-3]QOV71414.1 hypothetical protein IP582_08515 [Citrobacter sp. BDA59-3]